MEKDDNNDKTIFTLATLLSSFLILNSVGSIDEISLSQLSLVVDLAKSLQPAKSSS